MGRLLVFSVAVLCVLVAAILGAGGLTHRIERAACSWIAEPGPCFLEFWLGIALYGAIALLIGAAGMVAFWRIDSRF